AVLLTGSFKTQAQEIKSTIDSLSYAIGVDVANTFKQQNIAINPEIFSKAVYAALADKAEMTPEECSNCIRNYFMNESMRTANENKAQGVAFLSKNKEVAGVVTLPSGLQYQVLQEGAGEKP